MDNENTDRNSTNQVVESHSVLPVRVVKRDRRALRDLVDGVDVLPRSPGVDALSVER